MLSLFSHGSLKPPYLKPYKRSSIQRRTSDSCRFSYLNTAALKKKKSHLEAIVSLVLWAEVCTQYITPVKSQEVLQMSLQIQLWGAVFSITARPVSRHTLCVHGSSGERCKELTKIWWCAIVHRKFRRSSSTKSSKCRALPNCVPAIFKTNCTCLKQKHKYMFKCQKTVNNIPIGSLKHSTKTTEKPGTPNAPKLYSVSIRENSTQYGNRRKKNPIQSTSNLWNHS